MSDQYPTQTTWRDRAGTYLKNRLTLTHFVSIVIILFAAFVAWGLSQARFK